MKAGKALLFVVLAGAVLMMSPGEVTGGAVNFTPIFDVSVSNTNPGAHTTIIRSSDILFADQHLVAQEFITVPPGFDIAGDVAEDDRVGQVFLNVDASDSEGLPHQELTDCDGVTEFYPFIIVAASTEAPDEKARWRSEGLALMQLTMIVRGNVDDGHTIETLWFPGLGGPTICAPMDYSVHHRGTSLGPTDPGKVVWTSPTIVGAYTWSARYISSPLASPPEHEVTVSKDLLIGPDSDGDGIPDFADNCPSVFNLAQINTDADLEARGASVSGDSLGDACDPDDDNDLYSDNLEGQVGTDKLNNCALSTSHNAFPADLNNDTITDGTDLVAIAGSFGLSVPPATPRQDMAPDPADGFIDGTDLTSIANFFGQQCVGPSP